MHDKRRVVDQIRDLEEAVQRLQDDVGELKHRELQRQYVLNTMEGCLRYIMDTLGNLWQEVHQGSFRHDLIDLQELIDDAAKEAGPPEDEPGVP